MKLVNYLFIFLSLNFLFCNIVFSADCEDVVGATATISADCTDLDIQGDNADVTINSGVTVYYMIGF